MSAGLGVIFAVSFVCKGDFFFCEEFGEDFFEINVRVSLLPDCRYFAIENMLPRSMFS